MTDLVPNGSELCTHGEELHVPCDKCHSEQRPSKEVSKRPDRLDYLSDFLFDKALITWQYEQIERALGRAEYWKAEHLAANAEIDRLNADMAWIRRRTQFWGEVPLDPLGAETRAATSRDARSTEDAGRPHPSQPPGRSFTAEEAKAYGAFIEEHFEPASAQPPEEGYDANGSPVSGP